MTPVVAFALASALHAGFQLTVTVLVYPALAAHDAAQWPTIHGRHSSRITPLVGLVYALLVVCGGVLVAAGPGPLAVVGLLGGAASLVVTATLAAPLHGRLRTHDTTRVARLLVVDRWRCAAAVLGAVSAAVAVVAAG
ncbi:hypothetical protein D9V37_00680 [Nocardioides mangrovicus]|uniref:DUF1772 domain-containing protein n=1 Tax=Nocardioides mangrovicus TaxID=2478913 RepID=A0A3L8P880_9ACTN|nr:hypothetical protein [Nocardioides mangrovicus]RLV51202.1 hypothetical protein D9V37_00680 [Nocardioides mangrovicus]